jgi:hypothetical protein
LVNIGAEQGLVRLKVRLCGRSQMERQTAGRLSKAQGFTWKSAILRIAYLVDGDSWNNINKQFVEG